MYNKITNPETGRQVSIYGKIGQMVLRKYLTIIQQTVGGGDSDDPKDILFIAAIEGDVENGNQDDKSSNKISLDLDIEL